MKHINTPTGQSIEHEVNINIKVPIWIFKDISNWQYANNTLEIFENEIDRQFMLHLKDYDNFLAKRKWQEEINDNMLL